MTDAEAYETEDNRQRACIPVKNYPESCAFNMKSTGEDGKLMNNNDNRLSISEDWNIITHCLQRMLLFTMTDKFNHYRIIPKHLADLTFPRYNLYNLFEGGLGRSLESTPVVSFRLLAQGKKTNTPINDIDQNITLPYAIVTETGFPRKSEKHKATDFYENTYNNIITYIRKEIPQQDCAVLPGMYLIRESPLKECKSGTFFDYGVYFLMKYIQFYFTMGYKQVYIVFDNSSKTFGPKDIKHRHHGKGTYTDIVETTTLPSQNWKSVVNHRQNTILLCDFLSNFIIEHGHEICGPGQSIVTAGGFIETNRVLHVDNECRISHTKLICSVKMTPNDIKGIKY